MNAEPAPLTTWGPRLQSLREAWGWSLEDLSEKTGLSRASLSGYETGAKPNASLESLLKLQRAFDLDSLEALLGRPPSATLAGTSADRRDL